METPTDPASIDLLPNAVLRVACAGARQLGGASAVIARRAGSVFSDLVASHPQRDGAAAEPLRLQLLSGLADGADQCVAAAFLAGAGAASPREHIAVLPFDEATYRQASPLQSPATFDDLIARSSLVIELDGRWMPDVDKDPKATAFARHCRARAYRAQARLMLQRADLLLAVLDPDAEGRAGGTSETVRHALELGLPVLLLAFGPERPEPTLHHLSTVADLEALGPWPGALPPVTPAEQAQRLAKLMTKELAPPHSAPTPIPAPAFYEGLWSRFETFFGPPTPKTGHGGDRAPEQEKTSPFRALRSHVSQVNRRFSGRYRSGFLINFSFAAVATLLAATSLGVMKFGDSHGGHLALLGLALAKLALVGVIAVVTVAAHKHHWNDHAVNARYLAENLRLLLWLPALGKLRAPRRSGEHHADEKLASHTADALLRAAVRAAPPETGLVLRQEGPPRRFGLDAREAIKALSKHWTVGQIDYHGRNADRMGQMHHALERWVEWLNPVVIFCVCLDIGATLWELKGGQDAPHWLAVAAVVLVAIAASLPAAVAALNGLREQSEARRLAGRSKQLKIALESLQGETERALARIDAAAHSAQDPGAWALEALALAERCATLVAEDVAEWTVLYNKQILDT